MELQDWTRTSINVLSKSSTEDIRVPIIADPTTRKVRALEGIPTDVSLTDALQDWIERLAIANCFFRVATEADVVVVGHCTKKSTAFAVIRKAGSEWMASPCATPDWWRL